MSYLNQSKQNLKNYFHNVKANRSELFKFIGLILFTLYLTSKFLGSYNSTSGYDIRGEFCGYLLQLSFVAFLYISFRSKDSENFKNLTCLSFTVLFLAITNFLIIQSLSTIYFFLIAIFFSTIFLFLALVRAIFNASEKS